MEIVNAHVHMIELEAMAQKYPGLSLSGGISVLQDINASLPLLHPNELIRQMDVAGVSKSILYAVEAPIVYASNEYVSQLCKQYPERLIGFASVDPTAEDATAILEYAVSELGLKGLKLHPPLQNFFPNSEAVYPIYQKAVELDIPVVFHVGTTPFGSLCKLSQANPLLIDDVAVEFPDLRIMLTHLGTLWHNEAFMVVEKNPNVFIDTAAYLYEISNLLTKDLIERIGLDKIIFGTDYPMPYSGQVHEMRDFVDCINALDLSENQRRMIFSGNIELLLHGRQSADPGLSVQEASAKISNPQ